MNACSEALDLLTNLICSVRTASELEKSGVRLNLVVLVQMLERLRDLLERE